MLYIYFNMKAGSCLFFYQEIKTATFFILLKNILNLIPHMLLFCSHFFLCFIDFEFDYSDMDNESDGYGMVLCFLSFIKTAVEVLIFIFQRYSSFCITFLQLVLRYVHFLIASTYNSFYCVRAIPFCPHFVCLRCYLFRALEKMF